MTVAIILTIMAGVIVAASLTILWLIDHKWTRDHRNAGMSKEEWKAYTKEIEDYEKEIEDTRDWIHRGCLCPMCCPVDGPEDDEGST